MAKSIKELEKEIERLQHLAYKDELTGLYNRRGFKEEVEKFIHEVLLSKKLEEKRVSFIIKNLGLIVFDIDNFKKVNDTYGHPAGDVVIKTVAHTVEESVRDIDMVARWGGEEIVVGLVGASEEDAFRIGEIIREKIEGKLVKASGKSIRFTVSGGAAALGNLKDFEELFHAADKALYVAKKTGKNKIVKFSDI